MYFFICITLGMLVACNLDEKKIVEIEVLLKGGKTATLVCPEYKQGPRGPHGIECFIKRKK